MIMMQKAGGVRDLEPEDLPSVVHLFQKTFRRSEPARPSMIRYFREIFFDHPWYDEEIRSKVFVNSDGEIEGFIGVFPSRLELDGRPIRAAFAGSMMVDRPEQNPLAGARLLRSFLAGPQDISLTETANSLALGMWQKLALPLDIAYSLNWIRILRPAGTAIQVAERGLKAARLMRPLASLTDGIVERAGMKTFRAPAASGPGRVNFWDASRDDFAEAVLKLSDRFPLRPQWDRTTLDWFMDQAQAKRQFGDPCWRIAESRSGELVGCYAYYGRAGGIGWLLQALCTPNVAGEMVEDLFSHADAAGCVAIRGAGHPWLTPELISRKTLFYGRAFFVAHAKDKTLLEPIKAGQGLISGLAGENWTRLIGDDFD
ncbi:GNAT family N-acetyltransferase [Rhizobium sp. NFR07]|uniref:GNAT family N-acetyltransferase n=1 Tax=Rhizobium sp. NFR07 TaxID=1566262 RepID=UPI000B808B94|nr:GNAT family N-acetyltransferase [Rhizobium sp. NFR07]